MTDQHETANHEMTSNVVPAPDGTPIGYRSLGSGPGVVIVHGAMQSAVSQRDLAKLLAGSYRVHLIDRRGRGASGPYPSTITSQVSTAVEVGDLRAVLATTGARRVLGISSGAIIAARAALADGVSIDRLALFEPPLSIDGSIRLQLASRVDAAAAAGDLATVLAVGMKLAEMGPPWMFGLPVPILRAVSLSMLGSPERRSLAQALPVDFAVVRENVDRSEDFAAITTPTLLIDGSATRPYLRKAVAALAEAIPDALHVELPRQTHAATQNRDELGHPDSVAPALLEFFDERPGPVRRE